MSTAPGCYWKSEWKVGEFVLCLESGHLPWSGVVICVQLFTRPFNMVPRHLTASCQPVSFAPGRQHLPSTDHGRLELPRVRLATCGYILLCSCAGLSSRILTFRRSHSQSLSLPTFKRHLIPLAHIQHVGSSHEVYTRYVSLLLWAVDRYSGHVGVPLGLVQSSRLDEFRWLLRDFYRALAQHRYVDSDAVSK